MYLDLKVPNSKTENMCKLFANLVPESNDLPTNFCTKNNVATYSNSTYLTCLQGLDTWFV